MASCCRAVCFGRRVALAVSACGGTASDADGAAGAREAVMAVTATPLERVELTRTISMSGSVYAWQDVIIASEVGGYRVADVFVDVGDRVRKGQRLVVLSTALLEAEVASKQAALKQREAEITNAQAALERGQSLATMNLLSKADLDRLLSEQLASQSRLESARADLDTSQLRLKFTDVVAPDDGVITSRTVTVGQIAQAGAEMLRLLAQRPHRMARRGARDAAQGLGRGAGRQRHDGRRHAVPRQDSRRLADDLGERSHGDRLRRPAGRRAAASRHVRARRDLDRHRARLHGAARERRQLGRLQLRVRALRRQYRRAPPRRDRCHA